MFNISPSFKILSSLLLRINSLFNLKTKLHPPFSLLIITEIKFYPKTLPSSFIAIFMLAFSGNI